MPLQEVNGVAALLESDLQKANNDLQKANVAAQEAELKKQEDDASTLKRQQVRLWCPHHCVHFSWPSSWTNTCQPAASANWRLLVLAGR